MKFYTVGLAFILLTVIPTVEADTADIKVKPNFAGIELPVQYKDWKVISASHRMDNKSMRIILGNDIAIKAAL